MKKLIFVLFACICFFSQKVYTQQEDKFYGKQIYIELGGPGTVLSANFDGRFKNYERLGFGYKVGLGFCLYEAQGEPIYDSRGDAHYTTSTHSYYTIPLGLNYVFGKRRSANAFEVGGGVTFLTREVSLFNYQGGKKGNLLGHLSFMYRRQPICGGFTWRIGFTPIVGTGGDLFPMGAIGLGYSF